MAVAEDAGLLAGYDQNGFFCEMIGPPGERPALTEPIRERLGRLELDELQARATRSCRNCTPTTS